MRSMREQETGLLLVVLDSEVARASEALHAQHPDGPQKSAYDVLKAWQVRDYATRTVVLLEGPGSWGASRVMVQAADDVWLPLNVHPALVMPDRPAVSGGTDLVGVYLIGARDFNDLLMRYAGNLLGARR